MPITKEERAANAKRHKEELRAMKLHTIAERRAKSANLGKAEFIAEIVKGNYRPITAEDIDAEPNPQQAG